MIESETGNTSPSLRQSSQRDVTISLRLELSFSCYIFSGCLCFQVDICCYEASVTLICSHKLSDCDYKSTILINSYRTGGNVGKIVKVGTNFHSSWHFVSILKSDIRREESCIAVVYKVLQWPAWLGYPHTPPEPASSFWVLLVSWSWWNPKYTS